jgi:hypothetical protein
MVAETGIEWRLILAAAFTVMIENVKIIFVTQTLAHSCVKLGHLLEYHLLICTNMSTFTFFQ